MGRRAILDWLLVAAWAAVIFTFSSIPSLSTDLGTWDTVLRKLAHTAEYAILAALVLRATRRPLVAIVAAALYAVTDEWHQTFVEGRRGAPLDVLIDTAGAVIGVVVVGLIAARRRP